MVENYGDGCLGSRFTALRSLGADSEAVDMYACNANPVRKPLKTPKTMQVAASELPLPWTSDPAQTW